VAGGAEDVAGVVRVDVVPVRERADDRRVARGIRLLEVVERRVRETTPKPKVSSARLRSTTTISCDGSARFMRIAK